MPEDTSGEKVLPASPRKRREARKRGQVARSPDLSGSLVLLALMVALRVAMIHGVVFDALKQDLYESFSFSPHPYGFTFRTAREVQMEMLRAIAVLIAPPMLAAMTLGFVTSVAQVGFTVSPEALIPDFNRINPSSGFKRILSTHGGVNLVKGVLKFALIAWICWRTIDGNSSLIANALELPFIPFLCDMGDLMWSLSLHVCSVLFILALADYAYQKYDFEKNMRMSRQEMKQEMKNSDGDPQIKQKIKQRQRAMSQKRMMQKVPKATVVVTNPTHFAVALLYEKHMRAPVVVARGQDFIALRIKEIAAENKVPIIENKPVARALYDDVRLGREIPPHLYQAVAEVLAFVYRTKKAA